MLCAGDGLEDANFDKDIANASILKLFKEEAWIKETLEAASTLRRCAPAAYTFADRVFDNELRTAISATRDAYNSMKWKEGVRVGVYALLSARDDYRQASPTLQLYVSGPLCRSAARLCASPNPICSVQPLTCVMCLCVSVWCVWCALTPNPPVVRAVT
jgi:hypothetical protein